VLGSCWHWRSTSSRSASPWYSIKKERRLRHGWADDGGRSSIRQTRSHGSPTPDTSYIPTQKQYITSVYYLLYLKWFIKLLSGLNLNFLTYFIIQDRVGLDRFTYFLLDQRTETDRKLASGPRVVPPSNLDPKKTKCRNIHQQQQQQQQPLIMKSRRGCYCVCAVSYTIQPLIARPLLPARL
jgi:hypothetical protein